MDIVYLILAHEHPRAIKRLVGKLLDQGARVLLHLDRKMGASVLSDVHSAFQDHQERFRVISEVDGQWGKWSLVEAELRLLKRLESLSWHVDYVHLMSGSDYPIKAHSQLQYFLSNNAGLDFIEVTDIQKTSWVQGGIEIERFYYYYPFSYRKPTKRFRYWHNLQKGLGIRRRLPCGLKPTLGSQWWTLRWSTCLSILEFLRRNPKVVRYFKSKLIPDESFFQSLVRKLIPAEEIAGTQLLFHLLCPNTRPFVFRNGHEGLIASIPHFFIRKVEPTALELLEFIDSAADEADVPDLDSLRHETTAIRGELLKSFQFTPRTAWMPGHDELYRIPDANVVLLLHPSPIDEEAYGLRFGDFSNLRYLHWGSYMGGQSAFRVDHAQDAGVDASADKKKLLMQDLNNLILSCREGVTLVISFVLGVDFVPEAISSELQSQILTILVDDETLPGSLDRLRLDQRVQSHMSPLVRYARHSSTPELLRMIREDELRPNKVNKI